MEVTDNQSIRVPVKDISEIGEARRTAQRLCTPGDETFSGRVGIVVAELARNLAIHAGGGDMLFRVVSSEGQRGLEVLSLDRGPGMRNANECLRDGYSTAGTSGTGLGAVRRLANDFDLVTGEGRGAVICARLFPTAARPRVNWNVGAVNVPIQGETVCGDAWEVIETGDVLRVLVVDGLGHGEHAAAAAREAVAVFGAHATQPLEDIMRHIHRGLAHTRGAAGAVVEINPAAGRVVACGVGNVVIRILDENGGSRQLANVNGTLGANVHKVQSFSAAWAKRSLLIVHTDGLTTHWDPTTHPGLLQRDRSTIAGVLYRDHNRGRDDATVVVLSEAR